MRTQRQNNETLLRSRSRTILYSESGLIVFVWLVLFSTPLLFGEDDNKPLMRSVLNQLEILIPLTALFLVNRFFFVPKLLFKGRVAIYATAVFALIFFLAFSTYIYDVSVKQDPPSRIEQEHELRELQRLHIHQPELVPAKTKPIRKPRPVPAFANFLIFSVLV
ncbi:MAG: hypothetical protein WCL00_06235, partial [Bacteroidota bacterium]